MEFTSQFCIYTLNGKNLPSISFPFGYEKPLLQVRHLFPPFKRIDRLSGFCCTVIIILQGRG